MAFSNLIDAVDLTCLDVFGVPAVLHPKAGGGDVNITGIIAPDAMAEDVLPGGLQGTSVVRFFVRFADLSPAPAKGDRLTLNGIRYDIFEVNVDVAGGAVLKLRQYA